MNSKSSKKQFLYVCEDCKDVVEREDLAQREDFDGYMCIECSHAWDDKLNRGIEII